MTPKIVAKELCITNFNIDNAENWVDLCLKINIATGETSQAITPFHFLDYFHFFDHLHFFDYFHIFDYSNFLDF